MVIIHLSILLINSTYQEMRGDFPLQSPMPNLPGVMNTVARPSFHDMYGHGTSGPPFPSNSFMRPPAAMVGPSDANPIHLSPADVYRQTHEVTATVCIFVFIKHCLLPFAKYEVQTVQ